MPLSLDLQLAERTPDRVVVSISLRPERGAQRVDGLALELRDEAGESLGPRLLLPVSGTLSSPLVTRAELHAEGPLSADARVVVTAWWGCEQVQAYCPCEHGTSFQRHLLGMRQIALEASDPDELSPLLEEERAALALALPWLGEPRAVPPGTLTAEIVLPADEPPESQSVADEICEGLGLADDDARWLKELLEAGDP